MIFVKVVSNANFLTKWMKAVSRLKLRAFSTKISNTNQLRLTVGAGGFDATQTGGSGVQSETKAEVFTVFFIHLPCSCN